MAARFAAAFVLALALQVASAAPSCGCGGPIGFPVPLSYPPIGVDIVGPYGGVGVVETIGAGPYGCAGYGGVGVIETIGEGPYGYPGYGGFGVVDAISAPYGYGVVDFVGPSSAALATPPVVTGSIPPQPVGYPQVVGTNPGPASSYITPPACTPNAFSLPVQSSSTADFGPVSERVSIEDGCCSTSCAATRAKCSGTTKQVSFRTPVIIDKGSSTSSSVSVVGAPVATRETSAGTPEVKTSVYPVGPLPGPFPSPFPVPLPGPGPCYGPGPEVFVGGPGYFGGAIVVEGPSYPYEFPGFPGVVGGPVCTCAY